MKEVAIVDYGMCNLDSVARAVEECGGRPLVLDEPTALRDATHIILPGVGAFPDAMRQLRARNFESALSEHVIVRGVPFLGICLGMQMLATVGYEGEVTSGLGWIPGEIHRIGTSGDDLRVPHVGWNEVVLHKESPLFVGIATGRDFYFVHSYGFLASDPNDVVGTTPYGTGLISALQRKNVFGVQFHPEKSQKVGFELIRNFLRI